MSLVTEFMDQVPAQISTRITRLEIATCGVPYFVSLFVAIRLT